MITTHQLIRLSPLERITAPLDGFPPRRSIGDPSEWAAPEGCRYVPIRDVPSHNSDTHRPVQMLTETEDTWTLEEAQSVSVGITKLTLKRRLDALGKWSAFKSFLASIGEAAVDEFDLATEIRADDPMFQQLAPMAKQALNLTDEQYTELLKS